MPNLTILVRAVWDDEAKVWVVTSNDVPGLATEAETPDELNAKLQVMIPELLKLNDMLPTDDVDEVPLWIMSEQLSKVRLRDTA